MLPQSLLKLSGPFSSDRMLGLRKIDSSYAASRSGLGNHANIQRREETWSYTLE
jgi:hypothetical protein